MKKFFKNKKNVFIFLIVVLILSVLTFSTKMKNSREQPPFLQRISNDAMSIVTKVVTYPFNVICDCSNSVVDLFNTQQENDHLKRKIDELGQVKARNTSLENENLALKRTLKLKDTLSDYDLVICNVISRSPDSWTNLLIIDHGARSGIKKNMAVMSDSGLIGRVVEVNSTSSKVELITSTDKAANRFAVAAKSKKHKEIHGIITLINDKLAFTPIESKVKVKPGTQVYTSGMGGKSPKGLLVGTIYKISRDSYGLSNILEIKPAGNLNNPSIVTVVKRKVAD